MATPVQRAVAAMEAIKGADVTDPEAIKWAKVLIRTHPGQAGALDDEGTLVDLDAVTNVQLATGYLNVLRYFHRECNKADKGPTAAESARRTAIADAETETDKDLGTAEGFGG